MWQAAGLFVPHRKLIISLLRVQQVNAVYTFVTMVYEYTTILDIIHRPVFILNSTQLYRFVRTSQETHYVYTTSPTG
jgi:hypothetical protein